MLTLAGGAIVMGLLALLLVRYSYNYREHAERTDQRYQLEMMAKELQGRVRGGQEARAYTVHSLIGAAEGARLSPFGEYAMSVQGHGPKYAGTTITFTSKDVVVLTLTISDVHNGQWTIDEVPVPQWWELWK